MPSTEASKPDELDPFELRLALLAVWCWLAVGLTQLLSKASRSHKALKAEAEAVIQKLKPSAAKYILLLPALPLFALLIHYPPAACRVPERPGPADSDADKYFLPFKLACETDKAELRKTVCRLSLELWSVAARSE